MSGSLPTNPISDFTMTKTARKNQSEEKGQSRVVFLVSGGLLLGGVLCYFLVADFRQFVKVTGS